MIKYNVSVEKDGRWIIVASFNAMINAIEFAKSETKLTKDYHLVEVIDGGKH